MLYKVMLAEDETMFRLMLKNTVDWRKYRMMVVSDISDGAEAWAAFREFRPDIVITDLRMPKMDGLELMAKIRESAADKTKIVVLTCLEDFDMMRSAMQYGAFDYMLKLTMTPDEIDSVLSRLVREMEREGIAGKAELADMADTANVKEDLMKKFLLHKRYSVDQFTILAAERRLSVQPAEPFVGVMMEIDRGRRQIAPGLSLMSVLEEILTGFRRGEAIQVNDSRYWIHIHASHAEDTHALLAHIRKVMKTFCNLSVTFGISPSHSGFGAMHEAYAESVAALEQKFFRGPGALCVFPNQDPASADAPSVFSLFDGDRNWTAGSSRRATLYEKLRHIRGTGVDDRRQVIWHLIQGLHRMVYATPMAGEAVSALLRQSSEKLMDCETLDEAISCVESFAEELQELGSRTRISREVAQVMDWVREQGGEPLDLQTAAARVNRSYSHLSMLFKKETGISFQDYVHQVRMDKVRELLLGTDKKMYEIVEELGFADQSYFSRWFKRSAGITPSELRNSRVDP